MRYSAALEAVSSTGVEAARKTSGKTQTAPGSTEAPLPRRNVKTIAESRLRGSAYGEVRRLRCEFHHGVLTLRGRVSSYYMKQVAQHLVQRIDEAMEIDNRLEVGRAAVPRPPGKKALPGPECPGPIRQEGF
ncbi:MAG: BON domain-containing protein [Planctomycetota bacterium]